MSGTIRGKIVVKVSEAIEIARPLMELRFLPPNVPIPPGWIEVGWIEVVREEPKPAWQPCGKLWSEMPGGGLPARCIRDQGHSGPHAFTWSE